MVLFSARNIPSPRRVLDAVSLLAFCASCPLLVPTLDAIAHALRPDEPFGSYAVCASALAGPLALSAMAVALAFLLVCLVEPAIDPIRRRACALAGAGYAAGYAVAAACMAGLVHSLVIETVAGVVLGASSAVVAMAWMERMGARSLLSSFRAVWACAAFVFVSDFVYSLVDSRTLALMLTAAAVIVAAGMAAFACDGGASAAQTREGPNWLDVFGRLDMPAIDGADDFHTPGACGLFFVGAPLVMMVLFAADRGVADALPAPVPLMVAGGLAALVGLVALARFGTDRALVNASYRFFLPAVAFVSFAAAAFAEGVVQHAVLAAGGFAFLFIYAFMMAGILTAMAGRMASLALPCASLIVAAASLACLIGSLPAGDSVIASAVYPVFLSSFVAAAALLVATPGSRLWRVVLDGVDAATADAPDAAEAYEAACERLAADCALTPREKEALVLFGRGHTSAFVAEQLVIAESTARSHRKNIYRKLGVKSREELFSLIDEHEDR